MDYNPKLDYQFCKSLTVGITNENEHCLRDVFFGVLLPESENEHRILFYKKLFAELKSANDFIFSLKMIHRKLYGEVLSRPASAFLRRIFQYENEDMIYQRLAENRLYAEKADFIAFVYNAKRFAKNLYPIIFYKESTRMMFFLFRVGSTKSAKKILKIMQNQTKSQNMAHPLVNRDKIIELILEKRTEMTTSLLIKNVYLVGSCARNEMNKYSDVDLICLIDSEMEQKEPVFGKIHNFLTSVFNLHLDLKVGGDLDEMDLNANFKRDLFKVF